MQDGGGTWSEWSRSLDEFAGVKGYQHKHAIRLLSGWATRRKLSRIQIAQGGLDPDMVGMVPRCAKR